MGFTAMQLMPGSLMQAQSDRKVTAICCLMSILAVFFGAVGLLALTVTYWT